MISYDMEYCYLLYIKKIRHNFDNIFLLSGFDEFDISFHFCARFISFYWIWNERNNSFLNSIPSQSIQFKLMLSSPVIYISYFPYISFSISVIFFSFYYFFYFYLLSEHFIGEKLVNDVIEHLLWYSSKNILFSHHVRWDTVKYNTKCSIPKIENVRKLFSVKN